MTEQEFRELTAYQPSPAKNQPPAPAAPLPPPISPVPALAPVEYPPINQAYQAPEGPQQASPSYPQPQAAEYSPPPPVQTPPASIIPAPQAAAAAPQQGGGDELRALYDRLHERYKHLVEERDELSRQLSELHKKPGNAEGGHSGDYKEELRLLGKLIDDEQSLRTAALEKGIFPPGEDPYARHDKLVSVFLGIMKHSE
ncbi:MAG: hypothetical protein LBB28_00255 [Synergistaceae bacterium]|jgi:hypothetical protein|nr:hypothetical protein [Synergistaceae bacterium]